MTERVRQMPDCVLVLDSVGSSFVNYHTAPLVALALLSSTSATNILLIALDDEQTTSTYPQP